MIEMPRLMVDSSENDGKAEIVMDYVLSWCLRRADVICQNDNKPILYRYCRNMLALLCDKDLNDSIIFRGVRVWKEDQHIDLWVELIIENNGVADKHAILIENKYYSSLHDSKDSDGCYRNQLQVYKNRFDAHYNKDSDTWIKHYNLITCIERNDPKFSAYYDIAKSFGFKVISFYEMLGKEPEEGCYYEYTESDIFNEFWLRW